MVAQAAGSLKTIENDCIRSSSPEKKGYSVILYYSYRHKKGNVSRKTGIV